MTDAGVRPVDNGTGIHPDPLRAALPRPAQQPDPVGNRPDAQGNAGAGKKTPWYGTERNPTRSDDSEPNWLDREPLPVYESGAQDLEARSTEAR